MSWINKLPPKIRVFLEPKREVPDNLWVKCPETGQMVFYKDLEANQFVFPGSGYHERMTAQARLKHIFDDGAFERVPVTGVPADPLKFRDSRRYTDRLKDARAETELDDSVLVGEGTARGADRRRRRPRHALRRRLARHGGRRGGDRGYAARGRAQVSVHPVRGFRRRAHAGRHPFADADAAHDDRRAAPARGASCPISS